MTTWRDVPWRYNGEGGVYARLGDRSVLVCYVAPCSDRDTIGRAIAHAWNMDLAQAEWARELFSIDKDGDEIK